MSTTNEKPEDGNTETKKQQHEEALDLNALGKISGGMAGQDAAPLDSVADMYDARRPAKAVGGQEGKSGA